MSFIRVNDIFDELFAENKRLLNELLFSNKCLNVLIEIKYNFNSIIDELNTNLNENQLKTIEDLEKRYQTIESEKQQIFGNNCENVWNLNIKEENLENFENNSLNERIERNETIRSELNEDFTNNCEISNQCFESQNIGSNNKRKTRSDKKLPKISRNNIENKKRLKSLKNKSFTKEKNSVKSELTDNISEESNSLTENDNQLIDDSMTNQTLKRCTISGCDKYFPSKGINTHLIKDHKNLKEYKCCEKTFHSINSFIYHNHSKHCVKKQFECDFNNCGKKFRIELNLNCHKSIHYNNKIRLR